MTRFRNPWPDSDPRGPADLFRWLLERRTRPHAPTPAPGSFPVAAPEVTYPRSADGVCDATWIGHSTVLLQLSGLNLIADPVFSRRASPVQWLGPRRVMEPGLALGDLPPLDLVLLSHNHYDHLDRSSVRQLARAHPGATWVVPLGLDRYIRRWGPRQIVELDWWGETTVGGATITATPARHFSARGPGDRNRSLWSGFVVAAGGRRVFFAGDTAYHPEFGQIGSRLGPFDLTLIPIGAYDPRWFMHVVHVDPEEAVRIYRDVTTPHPGQPLPLMLGLHWGTFRLTDEPMDEPPRRALAAWRGAGLPEDRLWIGRFGETRRVAG
jgi:N-acyl-phosphatidylethanolamine-hydrolysing phospholipase D